MHVLLLVLVLGVITVAAGVDIAAVISFLRRWR